MTTNWNFGPLANAQEEERLRDILAQSFSFSPGRWDIYLDQVGRDNLRRIVLDGEVLGGLALFFMGQWFGGRSVPMAGVAAVGVPPEHRSRKAAFELMRQTLVELRSKGVPLSALYPATQALYRKLGYEQAGIRVLYAVPCRSLPRGRAELEAHRADLSKTETIRALYRKSAAMNAGNLDRNEGIWKRVLFAPADDAVYAYTFGAEKNPEGYIVFTQKRAELHYDLLVRDLVALTPAAARSIVSFFAAHGSMAHEVQWYGPAADPFTALLPEQTEAMRSAFRWMIRIVDVARSLEARGFAEAADAEVHLEVRDELLPENSGRYLLRVRDGRGRVERGGRGDLKLSERALATLYSGFITPERLAAMGWIEGPAASLAAARVFLGPAPWMPDMF